MKWRLRSLNLGFAWKGAMMRIPKRWWLLLSVILIFGCAFFGPSRLTQAEAEEMAGVFCLPTYLPPGIDPTPEFYAMGEPEIPDATALYKSSETSEHVFFIRMENLTDVSIDHQRYNPTQRCKGKLFTLPSNNFVVCYESAQPIQIGYYAKRILADEDPPFVARLSWLANRDDKWTRYNVPSTLPLEETKKIAASMCLE